MARFFCLCYCWFQPNPAFSGRGYAAREPWRLQANKLSLTVSLDKYAVPLTQSLGSLGGNKASVIVYNVSMNELSAVTLDEILTRLKDMLPLLRTRYHVRTLEVFGSYVRGEARKESDLDLLVTFDEVPTLFQFIALENYLSDNLGVKVDLVMKDSLKPALKKYILAEAQAI